MFLLKERLTGKRKNSNVRSATDVIADLSTGFLTGVSPEEISARASVALFCYNFYMRILIATGIYPPHAGGPAYYAQSLKKEFEALGHIVTIRTYTLEHHLPTGIRHLWFFLKTLPAFLAADFTIAFDTFSVGFPIAVLNYLFHRKVLLRTGGDFLWEQYIERTGEKILFSEFYQKPRSFTEKESLIFRITRWTLRYVRLVIFSTQYQQGVWISAYSLQENRTHIIENSYPQAKSKGAPPTKKNFVCIVRNLKWKNTDLLQEAFREAEEQIPGIELEILYDIPREEVLSRLRSCYAAILVSLGDISPNFVLEALSFGKPVILTTENGLTHRLADVVMLAHPLDTHDIAQKIIQLSDDVIYKEYISKVANFSFTHTYAEIAQEFIDIAGSLTI